MHLRSPAIILSVRAHGEHGAVVRALTPDYGLQAGYVRGGRSTRLRPVLQPGNVVTGEWRARAETQLAALTLELVHSRAPLYAAPLSAAAIEWATALAAAALPEGTPCPRVHAGLDGLLAAIEAAPAARGWGAALVRYELLVLGELGFGLALDRCAAGGDDDDLAFVSPKTGGAVSRAAAIGHEARLLPLPEFLRAGGPADWGGIVAGLRITGHFIERDLLTGRSAEALAARARLVTRIARMVA